jgi:type II secretory ATPase GspE/PulE/Tfp pilus assembly ATPase PilB-like protein
MAQRLVRKLDDSTKQAYDPTEVELQRIKETLSTLPKQVSQPDLSGLKLYKAGKSADNPYGYRGQLALREQFLMSGEILKLMQGGSKTTTTAEIEAAAIASGMKTMLQDGILKVISGETTLEEIFRVIG